MKYDAQGQPFEVVKNFTVWVSLLQTWHTGWQLLYLILPLPLLLGVAAAAAYDRHRIRWGAMLAFSVLPVAHFAYFYSEPRFYIELLPFLFVAIGVLLAEMPEQTKWAPHLLIGLGLLGNAFLAYKYVLRTSSPLLGVYREIEQARRAHPKLLVFAESGRLFEQLYEYNAASFRGPVVVARDLGSRNVELERRYPGYLSMRVADPR